MIHKFREADLAETFPELNTSPHILVMTDEAHRSQYRLLGANLDRAIPNAARIGYTGTPIDKTERVFGDYIDRYTHAPVHAGRRDPSNRLRRTHPQGRGQRPGGDGYGVRGRIQRLRPARALADPRLRLTGRLPGSGIDHRGEGAGHGRPLPDPRVPERLQGAGGRHVARSGRALQDVPRRGARSRRREAGAAGQPRKPGPGTAPGDAHGRGHLRKPQRSAAPEGPYGPVEARGEHQELQAALRRRRRRREWGRGDPHRQQHAARASTRRSSR